MTLRHLVAVVSGIAVLSAGVVLWCTIAPSQNPKQEALRVYGPPPCRQDPLAAASSRRLGLQRASEGIGTPLSKDTDVGNCSPKPSNRRASSAEEQHPHTTLNPRHSVTIADFARRVEARGTSTGGRTNIPNWKHFRAQNPTTRAGKVFALRPHRPYPRRRSAPP